METLQLDRSEARRIALRAQMLDADRPTDLVEVVRQLTLLQIDPTSAIAPSADLVAWSRLGSAYRPEHLRRALEQDRTLYELNALIRPMTDLGLFLDEMAAWPTREEQRKWLKANDRFRHDVLELLADSGPLLSRDIPDTCVVPWKSSGWTHDRNVTQMLEFLMARGEVAVTGRRGRQRLWDLAERVYPAGVPVIPREEALRQRNARRLQALGIARQKRPAQPIERYDVGETGVLATVEDVTGTWRVDPENLGQPFEGRTALLSPFDRLVHDRARTLELFEYEYTLEMYKPKDQRRWGYFALPILHGDRLVGKLDAKADTKNGVFRVHGIHEDVPFTRAIATAVRTEIENLAEWLDLEVTGL